MIISAAPGTPAHVLRAAADLIEPAGAWTRGVWARDARGRPVQYDDRRAICWCVSGAVRRVAPAGLVWSVLDLLDLNPDVCHTEWNDAPERTQPEVVAALRAAADIAEATE